MKTQLLQLDDIKVEGKTVLCRVDFNEPVNPKTFELQDITRIKQSLQTIEELVAREAKVVLLSHQGSDIEYHNFHSLDKHYEVLQSLIKTRIIFVEDICGPSAIKAIKNLKNKEILLLDNVRFMAEEQTLFELNLKLTPEQQTHTQVVKRLSPHIDYFVNEAFSAIHRNQPSISAFPLLKPSVVGRLFHKEYSALNKILVGGYEQKCYLLGGAKVNDAFDIMQSVLAEDKKARVLVGGIVGNIFLAVNGKLSSKSTDFLIEKGYNKYFEKAKELQKSYENQIEIPIDLACNQNGFRKEYELNDLKDELYLDIGSLTIDKYGGMIEQSNLLFLNGPFGVFEESNFELGTKSIMKSLEQAKGFTVIGGGDSVTAINKFKIKNIDYVCTAGGAMIKFLSKEPLPALESLKESMVLHNEENI